MNAENKSKCCKANVVYAKTPEQYCFKCGRYCELQKNSGLTLSEIYKQKDSIDTFRKMGEGIYCYKVDNCNWSKFTPKEWTIDEYEILQRKSDEAVKETGSEWFKLFNPLRESNSIMIGYKSYHESIAEFERLQKENAELRRKLKEINETSTY